MKKRDDQRRAVSTFPPCVPEPTIPTFYGQFLGQQEGMYVLVGFFTITYE
jgi:hypothetical protein